MKKPPIHKKIKTLANSLSIPPPEKP